MWNSLFLAIHFLAPLVLARAGSIETDLFADDNQLINERRNVRDYIVQLLIDKHNKEHDSTLVDTPFNLRSILENGELHSALEEKSPTHDRAVKARLFQLLTNSKKGIEDKLKIANKVHERFKHGHIYKLGFMVGQLKSNSQLLSELYGVIRENVHQWDNLKLLDAYDQVRQTEQLLGEILSTLKSAAPLRPISNQTKHPGQRIAWDYYDES